MSPTFRARRHVTVLRALLVAGVVTLWTAGPAVAAASAAEPAGATVVGRLVQAVAEEEHHGGAETDPLTWVETAQGAVPVESEDVEDIPPGSTVTLNVDGHLTGEAGDDRPVVSADSVTPPVVPAPLPGPVTNEVTVALVAPAGTTPDAGVTADQVAALVGGPVAEFWAAQTGGAVRIGVDAAHEWITTTAGCADARALWNEVAAEVHFQPGPGKHLLLRLSDQTEHQPGCFYALAEVGTGPGSGGRLYVREQLTSVIAHELGHNLGLNHSSALQCDADPESGPCRTAAYRDLYDVMGASWRQLGTLNAPQAALLGSFSAGGAVHLDVHDAPVTVQLAPIGGARGTRAVRLTDAEGTDYWLEHRAAVGQDAWLGVPADNRYRLDAGVLLRRSSSFPDTSLLLDGTPSAAAGWDADLQSALPAGVPLVLSGGDFTVTLRALADDGATLDIVPTAPDQAAAAPAPRDNGAGRFQADAGPTPSARAATPAPPAQAITDPLKERWSPASGTAVPVAAATLGPAARTSSSVGGLTVAVAGGGLAGTTMLVVWRARRLRAR